MVTMIHRHVILLKLKVKGNRYLVTKVSMGTYI